MFWGKRGTRRLQCRNRRIQGGSLSQWHSSQGKLICFWRSTQLLPDPFRGSLSAVSVCPLLLYFIYTYCFVNYYDKFQGQKKLALEKERIGLRRRKWVDDEDDTPLRLPLLERRRPVNGVLVRFCQWCASRQRDIFAFLIVPHLLLAQT